MTVTSNKILIQNIETKTSKQGKQFLTGFVSEVIFSKKNNKEFVANSMNFVCFEPNLFNQFRIGGTYELLDGQFSIDSYKDRNDRWQNTNKLMIKNLQFLGDAPHLLQGKFAQAAGVQQPQQQYTQPHTPVAPQPQQQYAPQASPAQQQSPYPNQDMTQQYPTNYPATPQGQAGPQAVPAQPQATGTLPQAPTMGNYQ